MAEDGIIEDRYRLQETSTKQYPQRTEKNVQDSHGTVIFTSAPDLRGGSKKTAEFASKHGKPCLHLHSAVDDREQRLLAFIQAHRIRVLNVAGSRASNEPEVSALVKKTLEEAFYPRGQ